jgi:hypothetical protein
MFPSKDWKHNHIPNNAALLSEYKKMDQVQTGSNAVSSSPLSETSIYMLFPQASEKSWEIRKKEIPSQRQLAKFVLRNL